MVIIFTVGIVQALVELKSGETIQFLDALEDTFISPVKRNNETASQYKKIQKKVVYLSDIYKTIYNVLYPDSLSGKFIMDTLMEIDDSDLFSKAEEEAGELIYAISDLKRTIENVNRHRAINDLSKKIIILDSLIAHATRFSEKYSGRYIKEVFYGLSSMSSLIDDQKKYFVKQSFLLYPILVVKHFTLYTIFNRKYLRKYETELEETSVFANTLRPYMQYFRFALFRDWGEKALQGRNGWLFYKQGVQYLLRPDINDKRSMVVDPEDKSIKDNVIDSIVAFRDELKKHGCELLVVIVPGKASIYPDILCDKVSADKSGTFSHSLTLMKDLNSRDIETVDLFSALSMARKDDLKYGDSLYLAQDTHWKTRGVQVVAKCVADRIKQKSFLLELENRVEFVLDTITIDREGDVKVMAGLTDYKIPFVKIPFMIEPVTCLQVYKIKRGENDSILSKRLFKDDYRRSKILVIGDSFSRIYQTDRPRSAGWISHLAYELSQPVCSIISDGGASTLVREKLVRKKKVLRGKKLVVWEFVERDIRYGADGWKDLKL